LNKPARANINSNSRDRAKTLAEPEIKPTEPQLPPTEEVVPPIVEKPQKCL